MRRRRIRQWPTTSSRCRGSGRRESLPFSVPTGRQRSSTCARVLDPCFRTRCLVLPPTAVQDNRLKSERAALICTNGHLLKTTFLSCPKSPVVGSSSFHLIGNDKRLSGKSAKRAQHSYMS